MGTIHVIKKKIRVYLYYGEHNPPHVHVFYNEYEAIIKISTGKILRGELPKPQLREVRQWLEAPGVKEKLEMSFHKMNPQLRKRA